MSKDKINLLYVITKLELGGAQKHVLDLVRGIPKEKFNLSLFTANSGLLVDEAGGIPGLRLYRSRFLNRNLNPLLDLFTFIELCIYIRKNKIDIVHTHSSKAGILGRIAARFSGAKIIVHTVHGWSFHNYQNKIVYWFCVLAEKICASFTDRIVVVSNWDRDLGLKYSLARKEKYSLIRYALNYADFKVRDRRLDFRKKLGLNDSDLAVTMVACFKPQKSPLDFIRLAKLVKDEVPNTKFILAGDGVLHSRISHLIKRLNLEREIILTGWSYDIPLILAASDIFVLTSLWEGLPISVLEAFASGLPVVVTDTGGIHEVISHGQTGYLARPKDVDTIKQFASKLLKDNRLREKIGLASFEYITKEDFSLNNMVANIKNIYCDLLTSKNV